MKAVRSVLSPEAQLALLPHAPGCSQELVSQLLEKPLDWEKLLVLAYRERSLLPVWRNIRDVGYDSDVEGVGTLRKMAQVWEFKLVHLEGLFLEALDAFQAAGIDVIVLKGAATALSVTGGFRTRPMVDVDLLLPVDQAEPAWRLAQELGWIWDDDRLPWTSYVGAHHLPPLSDGVGSGAGLEIHTRLWMPDGPFAIADEDVWREAVTVDASGRVVKVPCVRDQLHHCCVHFAWSHEMMSHGWRAFSDIQAIVASDRLDWQEFIALSKRSGTETCCYWSLRLAADLAGVDLPPEVLHQLRPRGPGFVLNRLERHFVLNLLPQDGVACPSRVLRDALWRLGIQRGGPPAEIHVPAAPRPKAIRERLPGQLSQLGAWFRYMGKLA